MEPTQTSPGHHPNLGALVYRRKHSGLGHTIVAATIVALPTILVSSVVMFLKQDPGVEPMSLFAKLGFIAFTVVLAGGAGLCVYIKGRMGRKDIETYERGVRLQFPSGRDVVFAYADVRQFKRRTFKRSLAGVEFVLNNDESYEIGVHGSADVQMLNYILDRYGPIAWAPDNSFRFM